jgi:Kdo2-lipid IVA lauroyltransferase/acyltransferase
MSDAAPDPQDPATAPAAPAGLPWWLRGIAALPLPVLYAVLSALMFLVFRVVRLRRSVVEQNLRDCFPGRSPAELRRLARDHYRQTGENIAETLKAISMPRAELAARVAFRNIELARGLLAQGRPVILVAAHQANWEWVLHALRAPRRSGSRTAR